MPHNLTARDQERLEGCHPDLVAKLDILFGQMPLFVVSGVRTAEQQEALYAVGRTKPGKIVTQCDGHTRKSNHQVHADGFGHAADVAFQGNDPFDASHPWADLGVHAEALGLKWGGHFTFVDLDHVELP